MAVVAATGFFDGVHTGHRAVLREVNRAASEMGLESAIVTFWPHPRYVLNQDAGGLSLLNTLDERTSLLRNAGIGEVYIVPFSLTLSRLSAREFISDYLMRRFQVETLVIGYDHRIGRENVSGKELAAVAVECGLDVSFVGECPVGSAHVSSTVIRNLLEAGEVTEASLLLGYDYSVRYRDYVSGEKVRLCAGRYEVNLNDDGRFVRAECMIYGSGTGMEISGVDLTDDMEITFLKKLN